MDINDAELGKLSPPADARARPPLEETRIEEETKLKLPGRRKLVLDFDGKSKERLRNQSLCENLFQFIVDRELHALPPGNTKSKESWEKGWEQAHNHRLHHGVWSQLSPIATPFEPYEQLVDGANKMRTLLFNAATHFSQRYDDEEIACDVNGKTFLPDMRMMLGKKIISERDEVVNEKKKKSSAKAAAKKKEDAENVAAEAHLGMVPGRGVSPPTGVELNDDIREGLAGLGSHTASYTGELLRYLLFCII